jgi:hypothetical protein
VPGPGRFQPRRGRFSFDLIPGVAGEKFAPSMWMDRLTRSGDEETAWSHY